MRRKGGRDWRRGAVLVAVLAVLGASLEGLRTDEALRLPDLDGRLVNPLAMAEGTRALVAVFVSVECPVSNRYAPALRRIAEQVSGEGVEFLLVYPNPAESPDAIRAHVAAFNHPGTVLRDPDQVFVRASGVSITPEVAVYDAAGHLAYRGRIDDRYVRLGLERPVATRHDLAAALDATLSGRRPDPARTDAVGCFIADFVRRH